MRTSCAIKRQRAAASSNSSAFHGKMKCFVFTKVGYRRQPPALFRSGARFTPLRSESGGGLRTSSNRCRRDLQARCQTPNRPSIGQAKRRPRPGTSPRLECIFGAWATAACREISGIWLEGLTCCGRNQSRPFSRSRFRSASDPTGNSVAGSIGGSLSR